MPVIPPFEFFKPELQKIENALHNIVTKNQSVFSELAKKALNSGGKRIRPMIFLIAEKLIKDEIIADSEYAACSFELLHAASLLHDDVIDHSETRRGKHTINALEGDKTSILLGDYIFLKAFLNIFQPQFNELMPIVLHSLEKMVEGEGIELLFHGRLDILEEECLRINELKTAVLFEDACKAGGILCNASDEQVDALVGFGKNLGCAFQIVDDILDYTGNQKDFGKPILNDFREGKATLPLVYTLERVTKIERELIQAQFALDDKDNIRSEKILEIMGKYNVFDRAMKKTKEYVDRALSKIQIFKDNET